ncbi:translation initiation factor IF-1 [Candidatus Falkowbacteria bacterium RIFOXYB2_FULL_34_18]|uniref:Translation initiation factor IF-1 n=1 Tax=Candidatus Falkowbacteria bacterium RIFOXYD2_FULL_34_120 TaxID=1798007 RepID=A0A1F5TMW2_9BACT|nr:MAG: translation initiation factor IF-1 [Candidatus Falkowbacteria bacterium RIFOXYC12_FULL_34_55]OGF28699.1 MAG: translation initiation factor IF-1 [Candidatus Falkowbacteria bacterium RIFOXYB2_FULL_34_18]OGF38064.1 MAG: translation initiation factor IF-1 [Candidatus Falkowbacteria bacterium RIFOXYC2_FULL_34_220]OGF38318.1 MAG: translation initiation factor IF-1 [Candidatus Falkowbacteria bacterium RIFOXYD12_FULL_34_57]OGF40305.1 MAG: translation initiation factor IF-1 [Candidatus Falkowbac
MTKKNNENKAIDSKEFVDMTGEIIELMPAASFRVKLENNHEILAHLSGKMRMNRIRLLPGDRVKVQMSPYDLSKGRITYRM